MYRIELSPGEETVFRSIEELAVAIRRGVVTSRARIYHNASGRWLPIQFHPHYKAAVSMPLTQAALVAGPPVKPLSSLSLQESVEPEPLISMAAPAARIDHPLATPARKKKARSEPAATEKRSRRSSKPRRQLRIALVGALLVGGAQWVLSAPLFSRADAPALIRAQRHLIADPTEAMRRVSSPNTAAMMPVLPNSSASATPLPGVAQQYPGAGAPSFGGTASVESESKFVEPAPSAVDVSVPPVASPDSVGIRMVDSSNAKTMKGILRKVSGAPGNERPAPKR